MEDFKFTLFTIIIIVLFGLGGYWAFSTIENGSSHIDNKKQKLLERENENLKDEIAELKKSISVLETEKEKTLILVEDTKTDENVVTQTTKTEDNVKVLKYQTLINEIQKLVDSNIYLKNKSQGPAVGTLQKFLNIYNNTNIKIDNDYGVTTSDALKIFQKKENLTPDGEAGPNTFKKMIIWLKSY